MDNLFKIDISNHIIGRFYFKRTQNGNLIGEFSNNHILRNSTESADLIYSSDNFVGQYNSNWQENGEAVFAKLYIDFKLGSRDSIYQLKWTHSTGEPMYIGEGFLFDGVLIGDYRNFEIA